MSIQYKVFIKDFKNKNTIQIGVLTERRKTSRKETIIETGIKWARKVFCKMVRDPNAIFVIPVVKKEEQNENN